MLLSWLKSFCTTVFGTTVGLQIFSNVEGDVRAGCCFLDSPLHCTSFRADWLYALVGKTRWCCVQGKIMAASLHSLVFTVIFLRLNLTSCWHGVCIGSCFGTSFWRFFFVCSLFGFRVVWFQSPGTARQATPPFPFCFFAIFLRPRPGAISKATVLCQPVQLRMQEH